MDPTKTPIGSGSTALAEGALIGGCCPPTFCTNIMTQSTQLTIGKPSLGMMNEEYIYICVSASVEEQLLRDLNAAEITAVNL